MDRNAGKTWLILLLVLGVVLFVALGGFSWYRSNYNRAVSLDEATKKAWSDVDANLQRRLELIPNLVETVKGYASHEKELFENIAKSREQYFQGQSMSQKIEASNQLSGLLSRLLVLQERYPDLKANQSFRDLQVALEGTENRIAVARTRYNQAAEALNGYVRSFFGGYFSRKADVEKADYFEASQQAKTEVPEVNF